MATLNGNIYDKVFSLSQIVETYPLDSTDILQLINESRDWVFGSLPEPLLRPFCKTITTTGIANFNNSAHADYISPNDIILEVYRHDTNGNMVLADEVPADVKHHYTKVTSVLYQATQGYPKWGYEADSGTDRGRDLWIKPDITSLQNGSVVLVDRTDYALETDSLWPEIDYIVVCRAVASMFTALSGQYIKYAQSQTGEIVDGDKLLAKFESNLPTFNEDSVLLPTLNITYSPPVFDDTLFFNPPTIGSLSAYLQETLTSLPSALTSSDVTGMPSSIVLPAFNTPVAPNTDVTYVSPIAPLNPSFTETLPTFTPPSVSLPAAPSLDFTDGLVPIPSSLVISVSPPAVPTPPSGFYKASDLTALTPPVYSGPVTSPQYDIVDTFISTDEDTELADAKIKEANSQITLFTAEVASARNEFEESSAEYDAEVKTIMQNAEQEQGANVSEYTLIIDRFRQNNQLYSAEVIKSVKEYELNLDRYKTSLEKVHKNNAERVRSYGAESSAVVQKFGADITNERDRVASELSNYQREYEREIADFSQQNQRYSSELQNSLNELTKENHSVSNKLEVYKTKIGESVNQYQIDVDKAIKEYTALAQNAISLYQEETGADIAIYTSTVDAYVKSFSAKVSQSIQRYKIENDSMLQEFITKRDASLQEFSIEIQRYTQDNSMRIQEFSSKAQANIGEYNAKIQKEVGRFSSLLQKSMSFIQASSVRMAVAQSYDIRSKEYINKSDMYYKMAMQELQSYIQSKGVQTTSDVGLPRYDNTQYYRNIMFQQPQQREERARG